VPRKPRFFVAGVPVHIVQRGHSREPVFFEDSDYRAYLDWLTEAAGRYACAIHAYVLMTNHIHILSTPRQADSISRMMQYVGRRYVPYVNDTYGGSGSIWEGRFRASLIQSEAYLLACMRYIELNPVRANMVAAPGQYRWSSYRKNAQGKDDKLVTAHALYLVLGKTRAVRMEAYRALFKSQESAGELRVIRAAWQTGTPLGNDKFRGKIERKLGCTVGQSRPGRPSRLVR
jgi:REP-associated tyrosine transposase